MEKKRLYHIDAIRALAMVGIVFLHVTSPITQDFSGNPAGWWWIATIIYSVTRPSIALFVLISGMMLLSPQKEETLSFFFKKRFMRIGIPFLIWGTVYFIWKNHAHSLQWGLTHIVREFIQGPVYYHLWFIYTIAGLYLATPVFRVYVKYASLTNKTYLMALWLISTTLYPLIHQFLGLNIGIPIVVAGGFTGCFLLGNYLQDVSVDKKYFWRCALVFFIGYCITLFGTYGMSAMHGGNYDGTFADFLCLNVVGMAISGYYVMRHLPYEIFEKKAPVLFKGMMLLSSTSFSVYLIHILVLEIFKNHIPWFSLDCKTIHPLFGIPVTAISVLIVCVGIVVGLRKVPGGKVALP